LGRPQQMIKRHESGGRPEIAYNAVLEVGDQIFEHLVGAELVFVIAGMGGGTGTGATPVIAQLARKTQAQVIGIAIKPFTFEGQKRMEITRKGLIQLRKQVDVLMTISNQALLDKMPIGTTTAQAFKKVDEAIVKTIVDIGDVKINNQQHRRGGLYYAE
ncbi:MAG: hypothetical protein U9N63_08910, partial [Pseudomonadota bacterium]|nr:hypothetical protein [Pseudomonadota bacterium]